MQNHDGQSPDQIYFFLNILTSSIQVFVGLVSLPDPSWQIREPVCFSSLLESFYVPYNPILFLASTSCLSSDIIRPSLAWSRMVILSEPHFLWWCLFCLMPWFSYCLNMIFLSCNIFFPLTRLLSPTCTPPLPPLPFFIPMILWSSFTQRDIASSCHHFIVKYIQDNQHVF